MWIHHTAGQALKSVDYSNIFLLKFGSILNLLFEVAESVNNTASESKSGAKRLQSLDENTARL